MIRYELLQKLAPVIREQLVICNIGIPSQELFAIDDQPSNFYMLGTMGLCSSIGLGLALSQKKPVIAIDGDGSILTNLATLATIGNNPAANLILLIIDNGSYGSTGDQPTYTSGRTSLASVARACGCETVIECSAEKTVEALKNALHTQHATVIVSKCDSGNVALPVVDVNPVLIRERFMRTVRSE